MPTIQIVNPLDIPDWDTRVCTFPDATIFHSAAWARVLIESYGFIPFYCVAYKGKDIAGILPLMETRDILGRKKSVSLPFTDFCEPLFSDPNDFQKVFEYITVTAQNKKWRSIELRGGQHYLASEPAYDTMFTHEIDLSPAPEVIFKSFHDTNRRNIRKAAKSGISVTHENSLEAMKSFYYLNCLTRREHGLPPQPWNFFQKLWETVIAQKKGFITLASYQQKPVAANLYMTFGKKALYKYGASDRRFQHLRTSNLVMWEGIKQCRELGCLRLHLGRTELHHTGLRQFKLGWTRNETHTVYYRYNFKQKQFMKNQASLTEGLHTKIFRILPQPVLKAIGSILYRYIA
jgi:hypothetical protein